MFGCVNQLHVVCCASCEMYATLLSTEHLIDLSEPELRDFFCREGGIFNKVESGRI